MHPLSFSTNRGLIVYNVWDTAGQEKFGGLRDGYYIQGIHFSPFQLVFLFLQVVTFNIPSPQRNVPSLCLMSRHESLTRTYPTGTVTWFVSVRTFPSSSAATRWTLKTEK